MYDAIWVGVKDLLSKEVGRRVLVILSDGADTQSMVKAKEAIQAELERIEGDLTRLEERREQILGQIHHYFWASRPHPGSEPVQRL